MEAVQSGQYTHQPPDVERSRPLTRVLIPSEWPRGRVRLLVHAQKRPSLAHPPLPRRRRSAASNWTTRPGPVSRRRTTAPSKPASTSAAKDCFTVSIGFNYNVPIYVADVISVPVAVRLVR